MPMGMMAESDWVAAVKTLTAAKLIREAPASDFYTNDLLDPVLIRKLGAS